MTTLKGQYTIIDVTDGKDGSNIWTTTTEPVNDRIPLNDLVGPESVEKQVGDIVFYSTFKYYISRIESGYATVSEKVDFKGKDGEDGVSFTVVIESSNGNIFRLGSIDTKLTCKVYFNNKDITDELDDSKFTWRRVSSSPDSMEDERWNTSRKALFHKFVDITPEDCIGRTVFFCDVDI